MKENGCKPQMPDVMEAIFDAAYLLFDLVAAIIISFGWYLPVTLFCICGLLQWDFSFYFNKI